MIFNSFDFLIFFSIVVLIYYVIPLRIRVIWLLAASYSFYMCWNPRYIILIIFTTVITYVSGILIEKHEAKKKILLSICIILNMGILFLFKYFNWILEIINDLLQNLSGHDIPIEINFLLPVGISFYTFQALSYSIDVYRGTIKAEHNILQYALFVSFFPQLVAGPIERSGNLLEQIHKMSRERMLSYKNISNGLILMIWGLFVKMVIADRIAILVDNVFDSYISYGSVELMIAAIGFSIQIYCDFSSYSIIAIGAAQVLGVTLMPNFETPYFSSSIKEFWRRWHISLSTWFRDYLYIPMGGNRCSTIRKNLNLFVTFLASGLWHGANVTYVLWGGLHGLYQIVGAETKSARTSVYRKLKINTKCWSWNFGQIIITFILTTFAWIFFRCETIGQAFGFIKRIFTKPDLWVLFDGTLYQLGLSLQEWHILIVALMILLIIDVLQYVTNKRVDVLLSTQNMLFRWLVVITFIAMIFIFGEYGPNVTPEQFIYFQF